MAAPTPNDSSVAITGTGNETSTLLPDPNINNAGRNQVVKRIVWIDHNIGQNHTGSDEVVLVFHPEDIDRFKVSPDGVKKKNGNIRHNN